MWFCHRTKFTDTGSRSLSAPNHLTKPNGYRRHIRRGVGRRTVSFAESAHHRAVRDVRPPHHRDTVVALTLSEHHAADVGPAVLFA